MADIWSMVGPVLMTAALVELGLLFLAPLTLARFAPFGLGLDRRLRVPASKLRGGLPTMELFDGGDYVTRWHSDASSAWVRPTYKWFGFNRSLGIGRVHVEVQGQERPHSYRETAAEPTAQVDITVRWLPVPMTIFVLMLPLALLTLMYDPAIAGILLVGALFGGGLQALMSYWRMKPALSVVADEIEMTLERASG